MITVLLLCVACCFMFVGIVFGYLYMNRMEKMWDKKADTYYVANRVCLIFSITLCVFTIVSSICGWI